MIKVFVGCAANHEDAESQAVLEYTLRKHTSEKINIVWMKQSHEPHSMFYTDGGDQGWNTSLWATPFSGFRWAIPWLCNYEGKAIYMDSDVIVMSDIAELWSTEFEPGKIVVAKGKGASWRYCVSLWDCAAAKTHLPHIDAIRTNANSHKNLCKYMASNPQLVQAFESNWNCLDGEKYKDLYDPDIKAIHYTSMPHQPHHKYAQKRLSTKGIPHWFTGTVKPHWREDLQNLFDNLLMEAELNGYPVLKYEQEMIFGKYKKASTSNMKGDKPNWG